MASGFSIGYVHFTIFLLWLTGVLMLRFDVKGYDMEKLTKEKKTTRFLGWFNVYLGIVLTIGNWVYSKFLW